jgi:hypothetical protein
MGSDITIPDRLIDPEGEGLYLISDRFYSVLHEAACALYGDGRRWRDVESTLVYMRPGDDDCWYPSGIGKHPRGWRLLLPRRWRPTAYTYCTPGPEADYRPAPHVHADAR